MTGWIVHYEVASVVILTALLIQFLYEKRIKTKTTSAFLLMLILALATGVSDLLSVYMINHSQEFSRSINYFVNIVYLISLNMLVATYFVYFLFLLRGNDKLRRHDKFFIVLPILYYVTMIATTPYTKLIFFFDEEGRYLHGFLFNSLYFIAAAYACGVVVMAMRRRFALTTSQAVALIFYTTSEMVCLVIQYFFPNYLLNNFGVSVGILLLYLSMQNSMGDSDKQMGTFNSEALNKKVDYSIRKGREFYLIAVQMSGFESINNTFGTNRGNRLIRQIAEYLMMVVPKAMVFHMTGLQFCCYVEKEQEGVENLVKKIEDFFQKKFQIDESKTEIMISCMIAVEGYPQSHSTNAEEMIELLNFALKEPGIAAADHVVWVDEEVLKRCDRKAIVESAVNRALLQNSLEVYYQPIYSTEKKRITCAEALLPLNDTEYGMISPDEFIPVAEKNGMIMQIGNYVFDSVCKFTKENKLWEYGIEYIEVNLSPVECMQVNLHERILAVMSEYGLDRRYINLEITETAAVGSNELINANMDALILAGLSFSLDDYGTGFSNTTKLIELPFKIIKLDKSILWLAMKDQQAMSVLRHTVSMLTELYREIVVEGVETKEQVVILSELGCNYLQGFYFSKPIPGGEFLQYLNTYKNNLV
ncbi:MAG TPA: GGDEF domain-containing phosphodiesterase [Lachnospiraceae bacterium]|nr:GGDEF domain-containing phosphodiesterase [Lachnospiraceae bacterium]